MSIPTTVTTVEKSYSLFAKAHFARMPKIAVVFLVLYNFLYPLHWAFAMTTSDNSVNDVLPVTQVDPTILTDTLTTEVDGLGPEATNTPATEVVSEENAPSSPTDSSASNDSIDTEQIPTLEVPSPSSSSDSNTQSGEFTDISTSTVSEDENINSLLPTYILQNQNDSQVTFESQNCITVGDGSFYCQQPTQSDLSDRPDGVYAYPDRDGDLEIFIQRNGVLEQVTNNTVDDASPWFDASSDTIVWHRLIDGRYHIISYNIIEGSEVQITTGDSNNMEPTRQGEYTVWQTWLDNNWEIVLYDTKEMYRITYSSEADVAPHIRNGLLLWSQLDVDGQRLAYIYNIETREQIIIENTDNELITNARLMVVFDSQTDNGDVSVKGYDLVTGEIIPISQTDRSIPAEIPSPNPVDEPTALFPPNSKSDITTTPEDVSSDPPLDTDQSASLIEHDFDDESTLVLFDYGVASSTGTVLPVMEEPLSVADFTLDLRAPDPVAIHTLSVPAYDPTTSSTSESLSSSQ